MHAHTIEPYIDIQAAIEDIEHTYPVVVGFGGTMSDLKDPRLIIKKDNVICMPSFLIALQCCVSSYFIFNIKYPTNAIGFCSS